jgi:hypothetical protein
MSGGRRKKDTRFGHNRARAGPGRLPHIRIYLRVHRHWNGMIGHTATFLLSMKRDLDHTSPIGSNFLLSCW